MTVYTGQKGIKKIMDGIAKSKYGFNTSVKQFNSMPKEEQKKVKCIKTDYNEPKNGNLNKFLLEGFEVYMKKHGGKK